MSGSRLDSLQIENFRSISGRWTIPLDAQTILIHGPNGTGKTSLVSAIELAATGSVGFLSDADKPLHEILLHRDWPLGEVELRVREDSGGARVGRYRLDRAALVGDPALDETQRASFLERSFLPQTALGLLLKTYTSSTKQVDTSLITFVKALVGLDEIDDLIDGLESLGHVSRTRELSAEWGATERQLSSLRDDESAMRARIGSAESAVREAIAELRSLGEAKWKDTPDQDLPAVALAFAKEIEATSNSLEELESLRIRLAGVAAAHAEQMSRARPGTQAEIAALAAAAVSELRSWEEGVGSAVLARLSSVRQALELDDVSISALAGAYEEAKEVQVQRSNAAAEIARRRDALAAERTLREGELRAVEEEIEEASRKLQRAGVHDGLSALSSALAQVLPLVSSEICPVCDQHFHAEGTSLAEHIAEKLANVTSAAETIVAVQQEIGRLVGRRREITQVLETMDPQALPETPITDFHALARELNALESGIRHGDELRRRVQQSQARTAEIDAQVSEQEVASSRLAELREALALADDGLSSEEELIRLRSVLDSRVQEAQYQETLTQRVTTLARKVDDLTATRDEIASRLLTLTQGSKAARDQIKEAERRKKSANELRLEAQRVRSAVINDVFDVKLNSLWAEIFGRFAPGEPFVPQFEKTERAGRGRSRTVDIRLDTLLPDGSRGAGPSSVLSYGNANTAALSLFLALHLSAIDALPWLIFDDPVQSMDDIHVSNFAAVVRQLTAVHHRQVIIAVHQRELFEYLALELAPSAADQSLIKVSLDRHLDVSNVSVERVEFAPEPSLSAARSE